MDRRSIVLAGAAVRFRTTAHLFFPCLLCAGGFVVNVFVTVSPGIAIAVAVWRFWRWNDRKRTSPGST